MSSVGDMGVIPPNLPPSTPLVEEWFMGAWLAVKEADWPANVRANVELVRDKPGQEFRCLGMSGNELYRYQWSIGPSPAPISPAPVPLCPPVAPAPPHAPAGALNPKDEATLSALKAAPFPLTGFPRPTPRAPAGEDKPEYTVDKWEPRDLLFADGKGPRWNQVRSWPVFITDFINQTIDRVGTHTMAVGNESYRVTFANRGPFKHHGPELPNLQAEVMAEEKGEKFPADIGQAHMVQAKPAKPSDGGPAFPLDKPAYASDIQHGMSLRDWLAGQALPAMIRGLQGSRVDEDEGAELVAKRSYKVADAMLRARGK